MTSSTSKAAIRASALAKRAQVTRELRATFAQRLATLGASLIRSKDAPFAEPVVGLFHAIKDEPETAPLIDVLAKAGVTTALPITGAKATPLVFRAWAPGEALVPGPWGIGQPTSEARLVVPDVLFVPVAAFDRRGARLGYGAGYYDATLAALRRTKTVRAIGVAFSCQEVLFVPTEPHDQPLDVIVTERDLILGEI